MKPHKLLLLALACTWATGAFAQWQWLDKDGRKVFSDRPPPSEVPEKWREYIDLNRELCAGWPVIEEQKEPLETAEAFKDVDDKRGLLSPDPAPRD